MIAEEIERKLIEYVNREGGISSDFGDLKFNNKDRIGQGGNGIVYSAQINGRAVALKFLISASTEKITRFKAEYFNINYVKNELVNVVNIIHFGNLIIEENLCIPYMIMSLYSENLKTYRKRKDRIEENDFRCLVTFLFATLSSIHKKGIIHRDIKPENILIDDEGHFVLADFGIARFEKELFPIDNKTKNGDRLANIEFSAPEQISFQQATQASDIYSMAQVIYWYLFGNTNRGTGAEYISQNYDWEYGYIYDRIIDKCLRNNYIERFQTIEEIAEFYSEEINKEREVNPFEDMYKFHKAVLEVIPEFYNQVFSISDKDTMEELFESIFKENYNYPLEFNTGIGNNRINSIKRIENDDFLMGVRQLNIVRVWGFLTNNIYDDILLLEIGKSYPYIIDGKEYNAIALIENNVMVPARLIESGYVRYNERVYNINELNIEERYINNNYKIIAIAPFHNSTVIEQNDIFMEKLQNIDELSKWDVNRLKKQIVSNIAYDVAMRF